MSCPFAGMTRIRFEGSPRISGLSAPCRGSPGNTGNVGPRARVRNAGGDKEKSGV